MSLSAVLQESLLADFGSCVTGKSVNWVRYFNSTQDPRFLNEDTDHLATLHVVIVHLWVWCMLSEFLWLWLAFIVFDMTIRIFIVHEMKCV